MDEAIWAVIGILSVIIGVSILANIFAQSTLENSDAALESLEAQCNQVCRLPQETSSGVTITLAKDSILTTQEELMCLNDECVRCNCDFGNYNITLNLTDAFFETNDYVCRFTKGQGKNISLRCEG